MLQKCLWDSYKNHVTEKLICRKCYQLPWKKKKAESVSQITKQKKKIEQKIEWVIDMSGKQLKYRSC